LLFSRYVRPCFRVWSKTDAQITDGVGCAAGAVLRALGLHTTGALINITSYYIIGLPFGLWLCFTPRFDLGLIGIWIGLSIALGYGSVVSAYLVWNANWVRAVERVRERLGLPGHVDVGPDGKVDYGLEGERERLLTDVEEESDESIE
jgi:MATE family multidrug resistance protein